MAGRPRNSDPLFTLRTIRVLLYTGLPLVWLSRASTEPDYWPASGWRQWLVWAVVALFVFCAVVSWIDLVRALRGRYDPPGGPHPHAPAE